MIKNILKHYPEITGIHPACEASPALSDDEYQRLSKDIRDNGLANDLLIDSDGMLVDGRHRLKACHEHAKEVRFKKIHGDPWKHVWTQNFAHRSPTTWGRALFGTRWTEHETAAAKERKGHNQHTSPKERFPDSSTGQARDKAGERVGVTYTGGTEHEPGRTNENTLQSISDQELIQEMRNNGKRSQRRQRLEGLLR